MKSLRNFIFEEYETYRVKNLEVPFNVNIDNDYITFKMPEIYSEDDFQIYLQDMYLKDLPGSEDHAQDFFGDNSESIFDVVFEYDKYEKSNEEEKDFIDWNTNYDSKVKSDDEFAYVKIFGLKYIIKFDNFDLKEENQDQIHDTLVDIFKTCENTKEHDWPLKLTLDEKNIKYQ